MPAGQRTQEQYSPRHPQFHHAQSIPGQNKTNCVIHCITKYSKLLNSLKLVASPEQ